MRVTYMVIAALCLTMPLGFLVGCGSEITTGPGSCYTDIEGNVDGPISVECGGEDEVDEPAEIGCFSPGGTPLHPDICEECLRDGSCEPTRPGPGVKE